MPIFKGAKPVYVFHW